MIGWPAAITKLISDNAIAAIQCKIMRYDERDKIDCIGLSVDRYNIFRNIGFAEIDKGQYDNLEEIGACTGGAMIIWKPIFDEIGHFDDLYFMYFEDIDLSWRLKLRGYKICPAISSVVYHVGSGSQIRDLQRIGILRPSLLFYTQEIIFTVGLRILVQKK